MRNKLYMASNIFKYAASNVYSSFYRPRIIRLQASLCSRVYSVKTDFLSLEDKYLEKDKIKILAHFNQKKVNKLQIPSAIDEFRAKSITEYKEIFGEFKTLEDILNVNGMGMNILHVICEKILTVDKSTESSSFFPKLDTDELSNVNLIVAFEIDIGGLGWTLLDRNLNVIEFSNIQLFGTQQFSHYGFKKKLDEMRECIPVADLYLLEKSLVRPTQQQFNRVLALQTVETMLMTMLYSLDYDVIRCKHSTVGKFFNLNVGNERTSGLLITKQMVLGESEHKCRVLPTPKKYFLSSLQYDQNRLSNSLLLALTYHSFFLSDSQKEDEIRDKFNENMSDSLKQDEKSDEFNIENMSDSLKQDEKSDEFNIENMSDSLKQDEISDEFNIEREKEVDFSNVDCNVEPNTTVLRLGEKLKMMKEEALEKMSQPKKKKPSKSKGKKSTSSDAKKEKKKDTIEEDKTSLRPSFDPKNIVA